MSTVYKLEQKLNQMNDKELIEYLMIKNMIKKEMYCIYCNNPLKLTKLDKCIDKFSWRCMTRTCIKYKIYYSIRKNSFFENIKLTLKQILSILLKYSCKIQRFQIILSMDNSPKTIARIISKLVSTMPATDFSSNKLGGPGLIVQIDETMLNYKCKSHRDRSSTNKTDSLCIVEVGDKIIRAFATTIPDKKESTLLPIICTQVANNSMIWTDEHRSYSNLRNYNFTHGTVCHKFEFVNNLNGVNTQAVESFNNCLKLEIKRRKGILTNNREIFLKEFLFFFNKKAIY